MNEKARIFCLFCSTIAGGFVKWNSANLSILVDRSGESDGVTSPSDVIVESDVRDGGRDKSVGSSKVEMEVIAESAEVEAGILDGNVLRLRAEIGAGRKVTVEGLVGRPPLRAFLISATAISETGVEIAGPT